MMNITPLLLLLLLPLAQSQHPTIGRPKTQGIRDGAKQLVKALQKAEAQLEKPNIGTITNLRLPAKSCFLRPNQKGICPRMVMPVCGLENRKEYDNCCLAVLAGESEFIRGKCQYRDREKGQEGQHLRVRSAVKDNVYPFQQRVKDSINQNQSQ
eukprot:TRINITY_DN6469_c0_g1_i1.p2 TRINITY_DN6469_c0_g1~~TRINITY_DN6469_c0_g1_i1.p2  ORF type:complete len:154 (-),score=0.74 TRINITY_DN6469_c0_g1_i1:80-541(-)